MTFEPLHKKVKDRLETIDLQISNDEHNFYIGTNRKTYVFKYEQANELIKFLYNLSMQDYTHIIHNNEIIDKIYDHQYKTTYLLDNFLYGANIEFNRKNLYVNIRSFIHGKMIF